MRGQAQRSRRAGLGRGVPRSCGIRDENANHASHRTGAAGQPRADGRPADHRPARFGPVGAHRHAGAKRSRPVHAGEEHSASKRKEILTRVEDAVLRDTSPSQEDGRHAMPPVCGAWRSRGHGDRGRAAGTAGRRRPAVARRGRRGKEEGKRGNGKRNLGLLCADCTPGLGLPQPCPVLGAVVWATRPPRLPGPAWLFAALRRLTGAASFGEMPARLRPSHR